MDKLAVFKKMTSSPAELFEVMEQEIGVTMNCKPFANKAIDALRQLPNNMTEAEMTKAAVTFVSDWQALRQGGITAEDYKYIDFIKRGKVVTISARVEAYYCAARRKGFIISDKIEAVPKEDEATTYFDETILGGEPYYVIKQSAPRIQGDRKITAERLAEGYFGKFMCRLDIKEAKGYRRVCVKTCEMSNEEIINAAKASDNGLFKSWREKYKNNYGDTKYKKVHSKELNVDSIWCTWTSEMVAKTIIRRALKRVGEVLPEIKDIIYAFEKDTEPPEALPEPPVIDIPLEREDVDLNNLTESQREDAKEMKDIFAANPKIAEDKIEEIMRMFNGKNTQEVINTHYASIAVIRKVERLRPVIAPLFEVPANA